MREIVNNETSRRNRNLVSSCATDLIGILCEDQLSKYDPSYQVGTNQFFFNCEVLHDFYSVLCFANPLDCYQALCMVFVGLDYKKQQLFLSRTHPSVRCCCCCFYQHCICYVYKILIHSKARGRLVDYLIKHDFTLRSSEFQTVNRNPSWRALAEYYFCLRHPKKKTRG